MFTSIIIYCLFSQSICDRNHNTDIIFVEEHLSSEIACMKSAMEKAPQLITQQRKEYSYFKYGCVKERN